MSVYLIAIIVFSVFASFALATIAAGLIAKGKFPLPSSERRIGCIDGLRGYLALSVLFHHFIIWIQVTRLGGNWEATSVHLFNQLGAGGVALFFMTTGLLFYPRVLGGFRACSWPALYTTRVFRIEPMVIFSVAIITLIIAVRTGRGLDSAFPSAAAKWAITWFSVMREPPLLGYPDSGRLNAYVLWSLSYEWLFYLFVLPTCALGMDMIRDKLPSWFLPVALLAFALTARLLHLADLLPFLRYLPMFAIGMIAYECQRREWIVRLLRTPMATIIAAAALGFGMIFAPTPYTFAMPLFAFFFTCLACGNGLWGLMRTKGSLVLGECSYGIYLLHGIMLNLLFVDAAPLVDMIALNQLPLILAIAAIAVTLVTPFTYLLIERPAIRAGVRLVKLWTGRRMPANVPEVEVAL